MQTLTVILMIVELVRQYSGPPVTVGHLGGLWTGMSVDRENTTDPFDSRYNHRKKRVQLVDISF